MTPEQPCPSCGKELVAALQYGPTPEPRPVTACFECGWESHQLYPVVKAPKRQRIVPTCLHCGGPRNTGLRYCSVECYGLSKTAPRIAGTCPCCNAEFTVAPHHVRRGRAVYCSLACAARTRRLDFRQRKALSDGR